LRNLIAHEYADEQMPEIYAAVANLSEPLLAIVSKVIDYATDFSKQYAL